MNKHSVVRHIQLPRCKGKTKEGKQCNSRAVCAGYCQRCFHYYYFNNKNPYKIKKHTTQLIEIADIK